MRVKNGVSEYLRTFIIEIFELTENISNSCYQVLNIQSLRNLQTIAMTSKMILQTSGVYFEDIIYMIKPLFNVDHQVIFEIAEWERNNESENRSYTTKTGYEKSRSAVYEL
jgi:hypothetical protein